MKVKVYKRLYSMSRHEYQRLLGVASEQVPFGIYAVEKGDYAELLNQQCKSTTELKAQTRLYRQNGFKVYSNGR